MTTKGVDKQDAQYLQASSVPTVTILVNHGEKPKKFTGMNFK